VILHSLRIAGLLVLGLLSVAVGGCSDKSGPSSVEPTDNPGGLLKTSDLPQLAKDYFKSMDGGIALSEDEIKGRNAWLLWTAGNPAFWDRITRESYGIVDLLKTLDSRNRGSRFKNLGLVNEPGMKAAGKPDLYGLWLDERGEGAMEELDPKVYGRSSGIMGLRIFANPDFNDEARKQWDPAKYYSDPEYYTSAKLVRPYRVGMACAFCHVAPHPLRPPADPENPTYENLASAIGNQYIREGKVFGFDLKPGSFLLEMLECQPPGTSDTSRVATDHINNPNAINPIFNLDARLSMVTEEKISGGALNMPGGDTRKVPHILKDGADSVGVPGATIRVFINIGLFSQHWLECHNPLIGLKSQKPFQISLAQKNSVYWRATEERLDNIRKFFQRLRPMHLRDAPGGSKHLTQEQEVLKRGKLAFAANCASCHSSKQPPAGVDADAWTRESVLSPDFLENNFLSDERRYPVTRIGTNSARALGTNATQGHVWDNFSSETYKNQKSAGEIDVYNPLDPAVPYKFKAPAGGPGYYRTPSLVSLWSSAPFFHNNALGAFTGDPSVEGRLKAFDDAAEKLL
jgi:hypothetical protein